MKRLNILFSTTRQWNCGDEFILFGVRRLLDSLGVVYNPIIYNRHPSICPRPWHRHSRWSKAERAPKRDNSFFLDHPETIDYVIFAGSPEWSDGPRVAPLLNFIIDNGLRCAFIGVGISGTTQFGPELNRVLAENCDLITARDPDCYELIRNMPNSFQEVCPALFSAPSNRLRTGPAHIGIVAQTAKTEFHSIPTETETYLTRQFDKLETAYPVTYIAHYIDEANLLAEQKKQFYYSGYSEDYPRLFDEFDLVISSRIHGCGLAASLGIPNILIPHDARYKTALGFKAEIANVGKEGADLSEMVARINIETASAELIEHRAARHEAFNVLLRQHLSILR